jgi:hypothetical protein
LKHIEAAIKEMTSSSTVKSIQNLSFFEQMFLISCIKEVRSSGLVELNYGMVVQQFEKNCRLSSIEFPSFSNLNMIATHLGRYNMLITESTKAADPCQKIKLAIDEQDIISGIRLGADKTLARLVD